MTLRGRLERRFNQSPSEHDASGKRPLLIFLREPPLGTSDSADQMKLKQPPLAASAAPSYDRTWAEIEALLDEAVQEMRAQHSKYMLRKMTGPKEAKYRALMKFQRAKGIVDTLKWTIGVRGQSSPLDEGLGK